MRPWYREGAHLQVFMNVQLMAVFVRVSGLLQHRTIRADLPIAGILYGNAKTALYSEMVWPALRVDVDHSAGESQL